MGAPNSCPATITGGFRCGGGCSFEEQLGLESGSGIEEPAPVQPQIAPKNDRLFWILPNYLTFENKDQLGRLVWQGVQGYGKLFGTFMRTLESGH